MATGFLFGGGTGETPETLARRREIQDALAAQIMGNSPKTALGGIGALLQGAAVGYGRYRDNKTESTNRENATKAATGALSKYLTPGASPSPEMSSASTGNLPATDISGSKAEFVSALLPAAMEESKRTGVDPRIIVAQAAQETGWGKSAPGNNYFGIKSHGKEGGQNLNTHEYVNGQRVAMNDSFRTFGSPEESVRGYGDFILQNPRYGKMRSAQGLDAQLAELQASGYATDPNYSNAVGSIARGIQLPQNSSEAINAFMPQQVASNDPSIGMGQPAGQQAQQPQQADPQQMQMAQNNANPFAGVDPKLIEAMNNPWVPQETRAMLQTVIQQQMQQSDPAYQMGIEKQRLELDAMKNPKPSYKMITGKDGSIFRANEATGEVESVYGAPEQKFRKLNAQEAQQMGLDPSKAYQIGPDNKISAIGSDGTNVTVNNQAENSFDKELATKQAQTFNTMADEGMNARADLDIINQLDTFLKGQGGATTGLAAAAASWGVPVEGADDLQAANALIAKLVPTQRMPGSGSMSDRDVELFRSSLPNLWNQPGGNERIIGVMRGLAQYKQSQGEIADQVLMGDVSRQEARRMLRDLPNPLEDFRKQMEMEKKAGTAAAPDGVSPDVWSVMTPEEKALWLK